MTDNSAMSEANSQFHTRIRNNTTRATIRHKTTFVAGISETELFATDESYGVSYGGDWFTANPLMADQFYYSDAADFALCHGFNLYIATFEFNVVSDSLISYAVKLCETYAELREANPKKAKQLDKIDKLMLGIGEPLY